MTEQKIMPYAYLHGGQIFDIFEFGEDFQIDLDQEKRIVGIKTLKAGVDWHAALVMLASDGRLRFKDDSAPLKRIRRRRRWFHAR